MRDEPTTLATALGSRICHDLTSPLGAIQNGLELLTLSPELQMGPELELVQQSAQAAVAKIRFFRLAFGQSQGDGAVSSSELASLLAAPGGPPRLKFADLPSGAFSRREAQKICLSVLCLATLSPTGGLVEVARIPDGFEVLLTASRMIPRDEMQALVTPGSAASSEPSKIHFQMLRALIGEDPDKGFTRLDDTGLRLLV